jgi:transcriptional regulator with XRE-family HTH domain
VGFSENLRLLRLLKRITQEGLAKSSGISIRQISSYENGKETPRLHNIRRLAEALGVKIAIILDGEIKIEES